MTIAYVGGIAPRSTTYMRAHWDHAKGFLDDHGLEQARAEERIRWQDAQAAAELDLLSPSYVETEDILRPLSLLPGVEVGALTRTFETNTFHRQPVVAAPVPSDGLHGWADTVRLEGPWVLTLPSPYDAAVRSQVAQDAEESVAVCLRSAAVRALAQGAVRVRFQEPTAAYRGHRIDAERLAHLLELATHGIRDKSVVHFTQGDVLARPDIIDAVPCTGIGIDAAACALPASPVLDGRELHAGVIRGESSLLEADAGATAAALAGATGAELWAVTNGWDLEHVPFDVAVKKLGVLAAARSLEVLA